jgi:hypothetical protein
MSLAGYRIVQNMAIDAKSLAVLPFGACLLHGPLNHAVKTRTLAPPKVGEKGTVPGVYSLAETVQLLDFLHGRIDIPAEVRPVCDFDPDYSRSSTGRALGNANVVLIEPNMPYEIVLDGYRLNRAAILSTVTNPLKAISRDNARAANQWFNKGLIGQNEEIRASCAERLAAVVPEDMPNADLARNVLLHATGRRIETLTYLKRVLADVDLPVGIVTYMFQYLPDGRPVSWPSTFHQEVIDAAKQLDLPVLEPWRLVGEATVEHAMKEDMRHYTDDFMPTMANAIVGFALQVASA